MLQRRLARCRARWRCSLAAGALARRRRCSARAAGRLGGLSGGALAGGGLLYLVELLDQLAADAAQVLARVAQRHVDVFEQLARAAPELAAQLLKLHRPRLDPRGQAIMRLLAARRRPTPPGRPSRLAAP